ncbi:YbgA family protein [Microbispora siamensis]
MEAAEEIRPRVAVSSCLLGAPVRFNGGHSRDRFLAAELAEHVDWVPVCPEIEIGLGAPRETLRLERSPDGPRLVTRRTREDLTAPMTALAAERAAGLGDVDGYVFKSRSPSCGLHGIPVYAGESGPADRRGMGVFAAAIAVARPELAVEDEGRLHDAVLREAFVERIFASARLRALLAGDWRPRDLVAFHTRHKMQILAHAPVAYRRLGRLVAAAGDLPRDALAREYAWAFRVAFLVRATVGRHVNVLHHCLGMISADLDPVRRADLAEVIASYRARRVALTVPLALLRHHARGAGADYVREQTYLSPYPDALRLRNHIPA